MGIKASRVSLGPKHLGHCLPLRWHEGPQILLAVVLISFALIFASCPVSAATGWPLGRPWCEPWMAWEMAPLTWAISLGILALAWDWLVHELDVHVGTDAVTQWGILMPDAFAPREVRPVLRVGLAPLELTRKNTTRRRVGVLNQRPTFRGR